ncbi:MAG TPA: Holliday junction resolvase RuvX [Candidatus Saccharimonadales bacterium]|nr:Holliday junction resolvase RuvX [Candidatus Saccharimonadales bacterium]
MAAPYVLALDYGNKRVGVAIAHTVARLPRPLTTLPNSETLLDDIRELAAKEAAGLVVVGLPRGMDGGYTEQTRAAERFAQQLAASLQVPVELADETLTSVDAEASLAGKSYTKADIDALAAAHILERYLADHPASEARGV